MSVTVRDAPLIEDPRSRLFDVMNRVVAAADAAIISVPQLDDDSVVEMHAYFGAVGDAGWRGQAACRRELVQRIKQRCGGKGLEEAMAQLAATLKVSRATLYRDVQLFETFLSPEVQSLDVETSLIDKSFFAESLAAPDPVAAVQHAAEMVASDGSYTVHDHRAYVADQRARAAPTEVSGVDFMYPLLYADPGWQADDPHQFADLQRVPVATYATRDAVLFLRCTPAFVDRAIALAGSWGFSYRSLWQLGVTSRGDRFVNVQIDLLVIATRGSLMPQSPLVAWRVGDSATVGDVASCLHESFPGLSVIDLFPSDRTPAQWDGRATCP